MFTGIIECLGLVKGINSQGTNKSFWVESGLLTELKIDQSLAHDGVCLTIEGFENNCHKVTAVAETLQKTTLNGWTVGKQINLERCLLPTSRLDGHFVQGHVDTTAVIAQKKDAAGSWVLTCSFPEQFAPLIIEKGSIAINGVSLTAFGVERTQFNVAIIPYTYSFTNLNLLQVGELVNLEFDLLGKYIARWEETKRYRNNLS